MRKSATSGLSKEDEKAWRALLKKMRGVPDKRRAPRTPEVRAKLSQALKGRKWDEEALAKRVASQTGQRRSEEIRTKFRAAQKDRGKKHPEAIAKMIAASVAARIGKPLSAEHRAKLVAAQAARRERAKHEKWYGRKG